ncbi:MAG: Lrp/AsnC family transcriptional regulator [Cyanobacteria bacterium P01_H01_bin.58]
MEKDITAATLTLPEQHLDELDQRVISLLKENPRIAFSEVANQLAIPKATARYRVQRLLQSGIVNIYAAINPTKLGAANTIIIRLNVEIDRVDAVAETLAEMPEIQFVAIISGQYNVTMDAYYGSNDELVALLSKIRQIPGIIHYDSFIVLELLKAQYQYTLT